MREERVGSCSRRVDCAALALHAPELSAAQVVQRLEASVDELGLAASARFVPGVPPAAPVSRAPGAEVVVLPIPGSPGPKNREQQPVGFLSCEGLAAGALPELAQLAAHAGAAITNLDRLRSVEMRSASLERVVERLQDSLLPPLPEVEQTLLAVQYRAAAREARVGGDFYDAFVLPDGRVLLTVGDVMGKGVEAAGHSSVITQTLRALAMQGMELDKMLVQADEQVSFQRPALMATVWCGLYEPASGELVFASLGHPPALLLRADGEPIHLALQGLPLGMRDVHTVVPECRDRKLSSRDLLVIYTDGVVEASRDYLAGQDALLRAIESRRDEPLGALVASALDELLTDAGHTDDAVMLLLRRR